MAQVMRRVEYGARRTGRLGDGREVVGGRCTGGDRKRRRLKQRSSLLAAGVRCHYDTTPLPPAVGNAVRCRNQAGKISNRRELKMRKIRIIEHISLDGVIQAPGG